MRCAALPALAAAVLAATHLAPLGVSAATALAGLGALLPPFITSNFEQLVKAAVDTCEALPLGILFSRPFTLETPHLDVVEYTRGAKRVYRVTHAHDRLRDQGPLQTLVLYVPGWWNTPTDDAAQALVSNLLNKTPVVLVLDTRLSFSRGYISSASRVKALARLLYKFIKNLHQQGVPLESIHIIGFSLGAHVAGMTGKLVQKNLKRKLEKITALDPAKPCFARNNDYRLDKGDANFVQVFHSSGVLGIDQAMGHVDVYINGVNIKQPECVNEKISLECDHGLSWKIYAESVMEEQMMGRRCMSWQELERGTCSGNKTVVGYTCSSDTRGVFLYRTEGRVKRTDPELQVFNPFDLLTWWLRE